jgi:SAM-dependent methyltransferase
VIVAEDQGPDEYLLGTDEDELSRLAAQHELWRETTLALCDRAGFGEGQVVADLGCGPGFTTLELSRRVGAAGRVVAVDSSRRFLDHLARRAGEAGISNVDARCADVLDARLERESLDGAHARWLFCYIADTERLIGQLAEALRPGGVLAVTDYFNYRAFTLAPRSPVMDRVVDAVQRSWARHGGDLDIQGRLPSLMAARGLDVVDIRTITGVVRPDSPLWHWPRSFFRSFLPKLERQGLVTREEAAEFVRDWDAREQAPGAFLYLPPNLDVIAVKR